MKYGKIVGESSSAYHANSAVSASTMKTFMQSPLLYFQKYIAKTAKTKETPAMAFGSMAHEYILEPDVFADHYVELPEDVNLRTKAGKERVAELEAGGKSIVDAKSLEALKRLSEGVQANPTAALLLSNGVAEVSWRVPAGEFDMQSRTDWFVESANAEQVAELQANGINISEGQPFIVDLKTTQELDAWFRNNYGNAVYQFGYQIQLAFYLAVINKIRKSEGKEIVRHFFFVVVEKSAPYDCAVVVLSERSFQLAQTQLKHNLKRLTEAYKTGNWNGYRHRGVIEAGVPDSICEREESAIFDDKVYEDPSNW